MAESVYLREPRPGLAKLKRPTAKEAVEVQAGEHSKVKLVALAPPKESSQ